MRARLALGRFGPLEQQHRALIVDDGADHTLFGALRAGERDEVFEVSPWH